jgi:hypothetical protein
MMRVALKDAVTGRFIFNQRYASQASAWETALQQAEEFFDQQFHVFRESSPHEFLLYFMSSSQPPMVAKVTLSVQDSPQESPAGDSAAYARMLRFELNVGMPATAEASDFPPFDPSSPP